jgi:N-acetylmuramoyl-L-alanine amidase
MTTGNDLLRLAATRIGQKYLNVLVPKDNPNWSGPWDCAEFASWIVFQKVGKLYGCTNNQSQPAVADAYSGAWARDAENGTLQVTDRVTANACAGVILIRRPPLSGTMGHIAISDGQGGTVEAAGTGLGVKRARVEGREWHVFAQIPGVSYSNTDYRVGRPTPLPYLLTLQDPTIKSTLVKDVQCALKNAGFDPGKIDGEYGPHTVAAVIAYQRSNRLIADGTVGPATARKLGVVWPQ